MSCFYFKDAVALSPGVEERVPCAFGSTPFLEPTLLTPPRGCAFMGTLPVSSGFGDSPCPTSQYKPTSPVRVSASVKMVYPRLAQSCLLSISFLFFLSQPEAKQEN